MVYLNVMVIRFNVVKFVRDTEGLILNKWFEMVFLLGISNIK